MPPLEHKAILENKGVIFLEDEWEYAVYHCYLLSLKSGFNALECEYAVVKDFCKQKKMDSVYTYSILKAMLSSVSRE